MFLYPEGNTHCSDAVRQYQSHLTNQDTFTAWTIESVVSAIKQCTNDDWIGLTGNVIQSTVEEISFGLKSISSETFNSAILSTNTPRWAMSDYGIICSGGCTVSIYPTLISSQIEYILNDTPVVENTSQDALSVMELVHKCYNDDRTATQRRDQS